MLLSHEEGLSSYRPYLVVDIGEHIGHVAFNPADQKLFYGFLDFFKDKSQYFTTFRLCWGCRIRTGQTGAG